MEYSRFNGLEMSPIPNLYADNGWRKKTPRKPVELQQINLFSNKNDFIRRRSVSRFELRIELRTQLSY